MQAKKSHRTVADPQCGGISFASACIPGAAAAGRYRQKKGIPSGYDKMKKRIRTVISALVILFGIFRKKEKSRHSCTGQLALRLSAGNLIEKRSVTSNPSGNP